MNKGKVSNILWLVLSVVAIVLVCTFFVNIMDAFDILLAAVAGGDLLFLELILEISPTILLLGIVGGGTLFARSQYKIVAQGDVSGIIRMVFAVLGLLVFINLFVNVADVFQDLYTAYTGSDYIAFDLICQVMPSILFLLGLYMFIGPAVGAYKAVRARRRARLGV